MAKTERELTVPERRSIRKLVTGCCANYDREYAKYISGDQEFICTQSEFIPVLQV